MKKLFLFIALLAIIPSAIRADEKLTKYEKNLLGKWEIVEIKFLEGVHPHTIKQHKENKIIAAEYIKKNVGSFIVFQNDGKAQFTPPNNTTTYKGSWKLRKNTGDRIRTGTSPHNETMYAQKTWKNLDIILYDDEAPMNGIIRGRFIGFSKGKQYFKVRTKKYFIHFSKISN